MWIDRVQKFSGIGCILAIVFSFSACPKRLVGGYEVKNGKVIYNEGMKGLGTTHSFVVEGADASSFKVINRNYGKDNKHAYLRGKKIAQSHGATFELIDVPYAKDKNHVYYSNEILSKYPKDFKILFKTKLNKFETIYSTDGRVIFSGRREFLPGVVDVPTFEMIGKTGYFRDKNNVYKRNIIEDADPETFRVVSKHNETFARDKASVFYNGLKVENCDVNTHRILGKYHHRDEKQVFFGLTPLSDDPDNFKILSNSYSKDSKNVYWSKKTISEDSDNFVVFPSERQASYAKDSKNAFWGYRKIEDADVNTFIGLNHNYAKDKNQVYFSVNVVNPPKILEKADPETFALVKGEKRIDARDKNNNYNFGTIKKKKK